MNDPLQVTEAALAAVVQHCTRDAPREACGFILAAKGSPVGGQAHPMTNVDPEPKRFYRMDDDDVLAVYDEFDSAGLDPVAVYHSHVDSPPRPSERDIERAYDTSLAYLIVSLRNPERAAARAYRIARPFVGVAEVTEVEIQVGAAPSTTSIRPEGPWALTPGNEVAITYSRPRVTTMTTVRARVAAVGAGAVGLSPIAGSARSLPATLPLDRIRQVEVLTESPAAAALRRALWEQGRFVASALRDRADLEVVAAVADALAIAFPTTIRVVAREEKP